MIRLSHDQVSFSTQTHRWRVVQGGGVSQSRIRKLDTCDGSRDKCGDTDLHMKINIYLNMLSINFLKLCG